MTTEGAGPAGQPSRLALTDPRLMRALAHPARLAILEHLTTAGAVATATECAEVAGLSPSATSYHLRALAKHGLIEEAPSRGDGRERVWRAVISGIAVDPGDPAGPEVRAAAWAVADIFLRRDDERLRAWYERAPQEPPEWSTTAGVSESLVVVTAEELAELNRAVSALVEPYKRRHRADPPDGARSVSIQYRAVPLD
jgi:DNA-binding transcriptional ArsR family regulator